MSNSPHIDRDAYIGPPVGMVVRIERPDGSSTETERTPEGRICATRFDAEGRIADRLVTEVEAMGVAVNRVAADGTTESVPPSSFETQTNPYGTTVEQLTFPGGLSVDQTYDDDGNLGSVAMRSHWGEQTFEFRPDGARMLSWTTSFHRGSQVWGAGGGLQEFEVTYADGTVHRNSP